MNTPCTTARKADQSPVRGGFTLIELVVVIAVVAVLATISTVVISSALKRMKTVASAADLDQVVQALEIYKQRYDEYPPDGTDDSSIRRHVLKRWPKEMKQWRKGDTVVIPPEMKELGYWLSTAQEMHGEAPILDKLFFEKLNGKLVYFRALANGGYNEDASKHRCSPKKTPDGGWYAEETFQLFYAGEDGELGTNDDIANFSYGRTMSDLDGTEGEL